MADSKVSELTSATSVGVADFLYLVQSNASKKVTSAVLFANAANVTLKGNINLDSTVQTISASGTSIALTMPVTYLVAPAGSGSIAIPAGTSNQVKYVVMTATSGGGTYTISANIAGSKSILFNEVGDSAQLLYTNSKWYMVGGTASIS
jgi:hypothetical protein